MTPEKRDEIMSAIVSAFKEIELEVRDLKSMLSVARKANLEQEAEMHRLADRIMELENELSVREMT